MKHRTLSGVVALALAAALAGCGGGGTGGTTLTPLTGGQGGLGDTQAQSEAAISATNAVGSPLKNFSDYEKTISGSAAPAQSIGSRSIESLGTCSNYREFFAPDKNGDPNSTEAQYFYDAGCTQLARDVVRIYTATGSGSENVSWTMKLYAVNNATPIATRNDAVVLSNATFDKYGFPLAASGFDRVHTGSLEISGSRVINGDGELVMGAASNGTNAYCSDSAGYNATGIQALNETFGWAGETADGTRTVNADGSVTWTATHAGSTYKGAIGSLSIATGTQNTSCPIATPMFTLAGGTLRGSYSIPVSATYAHGILANLTITNARLANGDTLNVVTNAGQSPSSAQFITGSIANGTTQIATFGVDAFGDGTLTVTSSGKQYVIDDWHVVK